MNAPASLSGYPDISVLQNVSLVNGRLQATPRYKPSNETVNQTSQGTSDLTAVLNRLVDAEKSIAALQARLNAATIDANCEDGSVTVALNL